MSLSLLASGTVTLDGTEQTVNATIATLGVYELHLDLNGMAADDALEVRSKEKVSATERGRWCYRITDAQPTDFKDWRPDDGPDVTNNDLTYTVKRYRGTVASVDYKIFQLA